MASKLSKSISDTTIDGKVFKRRVEFEGINYLSLSKESADIVWKLYLLDSAGNIVDHPDITQGRQIVTTVSNQFRVTPEGITITEDYVKTITPRLEGELDIDYDYRIKEIYNTMFVIGIPEFDFYWNTLLTAPLPTVVSQSIEVIDNLKGYDKRRNK
jgi:hypothetical protein